ncbi:MAG TPA: hypothetical protein VMI06_16245 [Terriglobia bacterium]|nr:hypothetical protein [Terriglobia bacterium]
MLVISKPPSAGQARSYHETELADAEQNYYSQKGAVQGDWTGSWPPRWAYKGRWPQQNSSGVQMVDHRVSPL